MEGMGINTVVGLSSGCCPLFEFFSGARFDSAEWIERNGFDFHTHYK